MEDLRKILRSRREELRLTLRDVERKVRISNAYLSQLENGKIREPTPRILRKLSECYDIPYERLMELAGHFMPTNSEIKHRASFFNDISPAEERELKEYLHFLRRKRFG